VSRVAGKGKLPLAKGREAAKLYKTPLLPYYPQIETANTPGKKLTRLLLLPGKQTEINRSSQFLDGE